MRNWYPEIIDLLTSTDTHFLGANFTQGRQENLKGVIYDKPLTWVTWV